MKKLVLVFMSLILVACSSDDHVYEQEVEEITYVEATDSLWWHGEIEDEDFLFQVHINLETVFGKYAIDGKEYIFKGLITNDIIEAKNEFSERLIFKVSDTTAYGVNFDTGQAFYASANQVRPGKDTVDLLSGDYLLLSSDYYKGKNLQVKALFDHVLLIEQTVYKPGESSEYFDVAFKDDDGFKTYFSNQNIRFEDHQLFYDKEAYTESLRIEPPSLLDLGLAYSEAEASFLTWLFSDYLEEIIERSHSLSGRKPVKGQDYTFLKEGSFYYLEFLDTKHLITNDLSIDSYSGNLIKRLGFIGDYQVQMQGDLSHFISNYDIKDQVNVDINNDGEEDVVLVIENQTQRILLVLEKVDNLYQPVVASNRLIMRHDPNGVLDPYDNINVKDGKLILQMYGGDAIRWSHQYIFDIQYGYRLVEATLETVGQEIVTYDFVTSEVIVTKNNVSEFKTKVIQERIDLHHFDYEKLFDTNYR